jgi:hypothetical protein
LWVLLSSLVKFTVGLLKSRTGFPFSSLSTEFCIEFFFFFEESGLHTVFFFPLLYFVLCNYIFGRLVGGFDCLISFPDLIVLWLT